MVGTTRAGHFAHPFLDGTREDTQQNIARIFITCRAQSDITPAQMAVLGAKGLRTSALLQERALAGVTLKRFMGTFDGSGSAVWTEGDFVADTIARFKGQSAPVVILAELDFGTLDDHTRRLLFTGITRALWRLECVMSAAVEKLLMDTLT